jgi:hypothetical protein
MKSNPDSTIEGPVLDRFTYVLGGNVVELL